MNTIKEKIQKARHDGYIQDSTYENSVLWLQPSFAKEIINEKQVSAAIEEMVDQEKWNELNDRFFKINQFGTAGVRGKLALGTAHFNHIILGLGVEAHARYIVEWYEEKGRVLDKERSVIIAYDSRIGSYHKESNGPGYLVKAAASIYAAHDIHVYLFNSVAPTPELSFAIAELSHLKPCAGGVFTASHNPASDNGFKPYDFYGGQIVHQGVQKHVDAITDYAEVKKRDFTNACTAGMISIVGEEIDQEYIEKENQNAIWTTKTGQWDTTHIDTAITVCFTSLNGTAQRLFPRVLRRRGFNTEKNLVCITHQCIPDGSFKTCKKPNPEEREALIDVIKTAQEHHNDMFIATDPDGDRIGVGIRTPLEQERALFSDAQKVDEYVMLNGNQQIVLLTDYVLSQIKTRDGSLPENSLVAKTIVTTDLVASIAHAHGVSVVEPHVGFKFIGEKIATYAHYALAQAQRNNDPVAHDTTYQSLSKKERIKLLSKYALCFLMGGEESYGSLIGDYVKDKDAVTVGALFVEAVGFYKKQGKTLCGRLHEIYQTYGYSQEKTLQFNFDGAEGHEKIEKIMEDFRKTPLVNIHNTSVIAWIDYLKQEGNTKRYVKDSAGNVLITDDVPQDLSETGYFNVKNILIPRFWHTDFEIMGEKACMQSSNVLMFIFQNGSKILIRPSGTEPKIKLYILAVSNEKKGLLHKTHDVENFIIAAEKVLRERTA